VPALALLAATAPRLYNGGEQDGHGFDTVAARPLGGGRQDCPAGFIATELLKRHPSPPHQPLTISADRRDKFFRVIGSPDTSLVCRPQSCALRQPGLPIVPEKSSTLISLDLETRLLVLEMSPAQDGVTEMAIGTESWQVPQKVHFCP